MLGDDDELKRGALDIILNAIEKLKEDVAFVILNWQTISSEYCISNWWGIENKMYMDIIECFKENYNKMPYGSVLCNLEYAELITEDEKERFMGTYHLYSGILWDMALKCERILRISEPVIIKYENEKSYDAYKTDVLLRAIPEWYDKLAEEYQIWAQSAKMLWLIKCFNTLDDNEKEELLKRFPTIRNYV